jgi:hypothetical protein
VNYLGSRSSSPLDGAILRAAINNDHFTDAVGKNGGNARADRRLLVEARHNGADMRP